MKVNDVISGASPCKFPDPGSPGARLAGRYCVQCHNLPSPAMHHAPKWGPIVERQGLTHYLRVYMARLRAKLEVDASDPRHLVTEAGVGYRLQID